jgi:L-cysteine/cystine lyase
VTFEEARALFPVVERLAYLNAGTFGPIARPTVDAMVAREHADLAEGRGGRPYLDAMLALRTRVRELIAAELCVEPELVALTTSTTDSCNVVLAGLGLSAEDEVVTTDCEHFGLLGPLHASGARVRVARVRDREPQDALEVILGEVGGRTRLIALSHVSWLTGNALPIAELQEASDVPLLVDGAQSVGALPVDARPYDFYTVSGQKWLCGPEATGALYVRDPERLRVAAPTYFSQTAYEESGEYTPRAGAARFDSGWLATSGLAGLEAALTHAPRWRFAHAAEQTARCFALVAERFRVITAPGQGTLVSFVPDGDAAELAQRLYDRGVLIRDLPTTGWLRVSCGWWTSDADLERLLDGLR